MYVQTKAEECTFRRDLPFGCLKSRLQCTLQRIVIIGDENDSDSAQCVVNAAE